MSRYINLKKVERKNISFSMNNYYAELRKKAYNLNWSPQAVQVKKNI